MKENRTNTIIAITALVAAALMVAALSFAIGKWSFGGSRYEFTIKFPNATGISSNSEVKFAGARVGRVKEVRLIPRKDQTQDPLTKQFNCVDVVVEIDQDLEIGEDSSAVIKQDGIGIAAKYVLLSPGPDRDSKPLANGSVLQGEMPFDLADLIQPAGQALEQAKALVTQLQPVMNRLDSLTEKMDRDLPPLMSHADKFLVDGDGVMANLNTPDSKENLTELLANLRVSTENLKVVSTNAKALTATLADKPWRLVWGGSTVKPPPESEVLKSDRAIRLKPEVDVNAATPSTTQSSSPEPDKKKTPVSQP
jgi:ABC-type transporter Mla subunit MlaD